MPYIDVDLLKESVLGWNPPLDTEQLEHMIDTIPLADVVEVVRCRDCKHNVANMVIDELDETDYSGVDIVCSYHMSDGFHENDYCSRGERCGL